MAGIPDIRLRSIRQPIPKGYVLGRTRGGAGPMELIPIDNITRNAVGDGAAGAASGGIGGSGGITQLTGDVAAGPGTGSQAATIANSAVTTVKITDANVTTAKLADNAVTTVKITDANVTTAKLSTTGVTAGSYTNVSLTVDSKGRITVASSGSPSYMLPLVSGDTPGPAFLADIYGQPIGVPL